MRSRKGVAVVVAGLVGLGPALALAQCGMSGSGHAGHPGHGSHESPAPKPKEPSKKIRNLLASEEDRAELMDAVIADREFMSALVDSIAWSREWNTLMRRRLAEVTLPAVPTSEEGGPDEESESGHHH